MKTTYNSFNPANNMLVMTGVATLLAGGILATAQPASAVTIGPPASGEKSLQELFDSATTNPGDIDAQNDQTGYETFTDLNGEDKALLMFEQAGWADSNIFGMYNTEDKSDRFTIFAGNNDPLDSVVVDFSTYDEVGFFLESNNGTFYTESALNTDGSQQAVVYEGDGTTQFQGDFSGTFEEGDFIIAFEDILRTGNHKWNDSDFNDMVVKVGSMKAVPEPSGMAALGVVGGFMAFARRRRQ